MIRKLFQRSSSLAVGAAMLCLASTTSGQYVTNILSFTDFDNTFANSWYDYNYAWPSNPGAGMPSIMRNTAADDGTGTNLVCNALLDTIPFENLVTNDPGAGFGLGFGLAPSSAAPTGDLFGSTNLADYMVSFKVRAGGLAPESTSIGGEMQIRWISPDDTIQPADTNTSNDQLVQFNKSFNASSNWTTISYSFDPDEAGASDGSVAWFVTYRSNITSTEFNINFHMPTAGGWDADTFVEFDDILIISRTPTNEPPPPPPQVFRTVLDYNFDDRALWYGFGGYNWSENTNLPLFTFNIAAPGYGVGGSNAWILTMDNTAFTNGVAQWAGGGTGGGGPADYSHFSSGDLALYHLTFDSRAEGLAPDRTETAATLQFFLRAPDDTLTPADADTDDDTIVRLDFAIPAGTNWQTTSYLLKGGSAGSGSKANFSTYFNKIDETSIQLQIENANSEANWAFDTDNVLAVDNFKLERIYLATPPVNVAISGGNLVVTWGPPSTVGTAKLQHADNPAGPFVDVPGTPASPYSTAIPATPKFYRAIWVPPAP